MPPKKKRGRKSKLSPPPAVSVDASMSDSLASDPAATIDAGDVVDSNLFGKSVDLSPTKTSLAESLGEPRKEGTLPLRRSLRNHKRLSNGISDVAGSGFEKSAECTKDEESPSCHLNPPSESPNTFKRSALAVKAPAKNRPTTNRGTKIVPLYDGLGSSGDRLSSESESEDEQLINAGGNLTELKKLKFDGPNECVGNVEIIVGKSEELETEETKERGKKLDVVVGKSMKPKIIEPIERGKFQEIMEGKSEKQKIKKPKERGKSSEQITIEKLEKLAIPVDDSLKHENRNNDTTIIDDSPNTENSERLDQESPYFTSDQEVSVGMIANHNQKTLSKTAVNKFNRRDATTGSMIVCEMKGKRRSARSRKTTVSPKRLPGGKSNNEKIKFSKEKLSKVVENNVKPQLNSKKQGTNNAALGSGSSDSEDWEDVEELPNTEPILDFEPQQPSTSNSEPSGSGAGTAGSGSIQITLSRCQKKRTRKEKNMADILKREVNRFRKDAQEAVHQTHLLTLIYEAMQLSAAANDATVKALALSLIPSGFAETAKFGFDCQVTERFSKWYSSAIKYIRLASDLSSSNFLTTGLAVEDLKATFEAKQTNLSHLFALAFVACLRCLGLDVRLVLHVSPLPLKPQAFDMKEALSLGDDEMPLKNDQSVLEHDSKSPLPKPHKGNATNPKKTTYKRTSMSKKKKKPSSMLRDDQAMNNQSIGHCWAEIFLDSEDRWVPVDPETAEVDRPIASFGRCSGDVVYVIGVDNDNAVKDVSIRYVVPSKRCRSHRTDDHWLKRCFWPFRSLNMTRNRAEDLQLHQTMADVPLPTALSDYKKHPLFVLETDVKKYEYIWPTNVKPVSHFKGVPVYRRENVHILHTENNWIKEARVIRPGEKPCKVAVGARVHPKIDPMGVPMPHPGIATDSEGRRIQELFGFWQTEEYIPPLVVDGMIPRNAYGNIYVYTPSMVPAGCVHVPVPGTFAVAKKLRIDAVPAVTGWEFSGFSSHPVTSGVVILEENRERLLDEWDREEARQAVRRAEKATQRAIANWRKLAKGLLVKRDIMARFGVQEEDSQELGGFISGQSELEANVKNDKSISHAVDNEPISDRSIVFGSRDQSNPPINDDPLTDPSDLDVQMQDQDDQEEQFQDSKAWPQNRGTFDLDEGRAKK